MELNTVDDTIENLFSTKVPKVGTTYLVYDNVVKYLRKAKVININYDVSCCKGTDSEHSHAATYDVKFDDRISKGHLNFES